MSFPNNFTWGVATASYQIEGARFEDGRKDSVWDMLCRKPRAIKEGHNGDVACDHYHRYPEDVQLMKNLGLNGYRFSIAWPRVISDAHGTVNHKGLAFYDRLVDELLAAGITPWATLFHWDMPVDLYHKGGWMNPDSAEWFADYTAAVSDRLSDRVTHWMTQNESQCFIGLGLQDGVHAPGDKHAFAEVLLACHNSMVAHGRAVQVLRQTAKKPAYVGIAPACNMMIPVAETPENIEAGRMATFEVKDRTMWNLAWWLDAIFFGKYPEEGLEAYGLDVPKYTDAEMKIISEPIDFLGMNIYHGKYVKADGKGGWEYVKERVGRPLTQFDWNVTPECLYWGPRYYQERYKAPVVITENGLANQDWVAMDGKVHDPQRIDFLKRHLLQLERAINDGVRVDGYLQWSLMDNFEWAEGYTKRFGLVFVDYETQERIPKDSYHWYKEVVASNGRALHDESVVLSGA